MLWNEHSCIFAQSRGKSDGDPDSYPEFWLFRGTISHHRTIRKECGSSGDELLPDNCRPELSTGFYLSRCQCDRAGWPETDMASVPPARTRDGWRGGPVTHFSVAVFQSMIVMTIDRKKVGPYHAHLQMARDGDGWTIISIDRV